MQINSAVYIAQVKEVPAGPKGKTIDKFDKEKQPSNVKDIVEDPSKLILPDLFDEKPKEKQTPKPELPPLPEYKGGSLEELLKFNELLKQRLKDQGQEVPDNPLGFPRDETPKDLKVPQEPKKEEPEAPKRKKKRRRGISLLC